MTDVLIFFDPRTRGRVSIQLGNQSEEMTSEAAAALGAKLIACAALQSPERVGALDRVSARLTKLFAEIAEAEVTLARIGQPAAVVVPETEAAPEVEPDLLPEPAAAEWEDVPPSPVFEVFQRTKAVTEADRTCSKCRLTFETMVAVQTHRCHPEKVIDCDVCGRPCNGGTGLAAHRRNRHPEVPSIQRAAAADAQVIDLPAEEQREREALADQVEALDTDALSAEWTEQAATNPGTGRHRFDGIHRQVRDDSATPEKRIYCECEWVTLPYPTREEAREAFRAHVDEMEAARRKLRSA